MDKAPATHLNSTGCRIAISEGKGRGVFATRTLPSQTIIEISPVLLFNKEEYDQHGRHTIIDHYTFNWPDGRMALALGLGSLFNHSETPNVSYSIDTSTDSIVYKTSRTVQADEELCIFYGHKLWFAAAGTSDNNGQPAIQEGVGLADWSDIQNVLDDRNPYLNGNPTELLAETDLPFVRTKVQPDEEEEDDECSVNTIQAWVVDIPDSKSTTRLLKWVKASGLETEDLAHLKRIRRGQSSDSSTILLSVTSAPPPLPSDIPLPAPIQLSVPASAALTPAALKAKLAIWPTVYTPRRKWEPERWTRAQAAWAWAAVEMLRREAARAEASEELPIVAYVPTPYSDDTRGEDEASNAMPSFIATDTRRSSSHPLRHAVLNVVRKVADWRAAHPLAGPSRVASPRSTPIVDFGPAAVTLDSAPCATPLMPSSSYPSPSPSPAPTNGAHYLLTSLTLFTTHEPCIMCSMALLHSRVRAVYFLVPMPRTGGCGGAHGRGTCVPRLKGVNHRYVVGRWKDVGGLTGVAEDMDA